MTIRDPKQPLVNIPVKHKLELAHHQVLADLIHALAMEHYQILNYNHIQTAYPKQDYPLTHKKHRYDLLVKRQHLVALIEIKTTNLGELVWEGADKVGKGKKRTD